MARNGSMPPRHSRCARRQSHSFQGSTSTCQRKWLVLRPVRLACSSAVGRHSSFKGPTRSSNQDRRHKHITRPRRDLSLSACTTNLPRMASTPCDERRDQIATWLSPPGPSPSKDVGSASFGTAAALVSVGNRGYAGLRDAQLAARAAGSRRCCGLRPNRRWRGCRAFLFRTLRWGE